MTNRKDRVSQYVPDTAKQIGNPAHTGNSACMGQRGADIIDELLFNQLFAVPDAVEDFTHCDGCDGMLANETEAFLVSAGVGSSIQNMR